MKEKSISFYTYFHIFNNGTLNSNLTAWLNPFCHDSLQSILKAWLIVKQPNRNSSPIKNKRAINKISMSQNCQRGVKGQNIQQTYHATLLILCWSLTHTHTHKEIWDKTGKGIMKSHDPFVFLPLWFVSIISNCGFTLLWSLQFVKTV